MGQVYPRMAGLQVFDEGCGRTGPFRLDMSGSIRRGRAEEESRMRQQVGGHEPPPPATSRGRTGDAGNQLVAIPGAHQSRRRPSRLRRVTHPVGAAEEGGAHRVLEEVVPDGGWDFVDAKALSSGQSLPPDS